MDGEETDSGERGIKSQAKIVGIALRNTSLSYDDILWKIPYKALMICLLSSRYIPEKKGSSSERKVPLENRNEITNDELHSFVFSMGGAVRRKNK